MITIEIDNISMRFNTAPTMFSPNKLDAGTAAMLSCVNFSPSDKVLDLGCGYGVVGIYAAKIIGEERVTMTDINKVAVSMSAKNAQLNNVSGLRVIQSDGFHSIDDTGYTLILSNPPYHTDFSVAKHFIEKGFNRLALGGRMAMVTKRLAWYKNKITAIFGGVHTVEVDGYYVFIAEKRDVHYAKQRK